MPLFTEVVSILLRRPPRNPLSANGRMRVAVRPQQSAECLYQTASPLQEDCRSTSGIGQHYRLQPIVLA
jgi:hypothetical protein